MTTSILLVRHGQTEWNAAGRWQGSADIPLNTRGIEQAAALGQRLANWPLAAIYSSPLSRAAATARAVAQHHALDVRLEAAWREKSAGDCEGMTHAEIAEKYPAVNLSFGQFIAPNGETYDQLRARIIPAFRQLEAAHAEETVLVVSHGGTIASLIAHVLDMPHRESWRFVGGYNTGLSRIERTKRGWRLTRLNDTAHLE